MEVFEVVDVALAKYKECFHSKPSVCSIAPGRVNLIGEHTDYNDGFVLPMALPLLTIIVGSRNNSHKCHIITVSKFVDHPKSIEFLLPMDASSSLTPGKPAWANYIKGVISKFPGRVCGFNAVVSTSIPVGGGLSSSAALEVATYKFLETITGITPYSRWQDKAKICQKAEHDFCGVPCGIMDQFISFMGKEDCALLLDCRSLDFTEVPITDPNISILITNTNVRHELAASEYSIRRKQCEEAAAVIGKSSLRDVTLNELMENQSKLDPVVFRRARHVITEIERTSQSAVALQQQNYKEFGRLMNESHQSLKDDYEVSCSELNQVVRAARRCNGVYGSRMTGGGFGGCSVTLLNISAVPEVIEAIKSDYFGDPIFRICRPSAGAQVLKLE